MRNRVILSVLLIFAAITGTSARDPVRIDASSDIAANTTFEKMMRDCPRGQQKALVAAIVQLNLTGTHTVYEVVNDANKLQISAAHVKDQISGMSADEIIAFAASTRKPDDPRVEAK
jgi:hypothetical protein